MYTYTFCISSPCEEVLRDQQVCAVCAWVVHTAVLLISVGQMKVRLQANRTHLLSRHFANFLIKWLLNKPRVKCNVLPRNIVCLLLWGVECESTKASSYSPLPSLRLKWDTCLPTPAVCPSFLKMQSLVGTPPTGECRLTKLLLGLWYKWEEIPTPVVPTSSSINTAESKPSEKTCSNEVCDFFPCVLEWHKKYSRIPKMEK